MTARRHRFQNPALLGTVVDVSFDVSPEVDGQVGEAASATRAEMVADSLFAEFDRLQAVFSAFDPGSELSRWRTGELPGSETSDEFAALMADALTWQVWSGGLFNPLVGELSAVWGAAEAAQREPDPEVLVKVASSISEPRYEMVDGRPERTGDCFRFNLNAVAKGWIVDRAVDLTVVRFDEIDDVLVNAGGDLRHRGRGTARVGIANPRRPYDNEPPITVIEITDEAVATSGGGRRDLRIGDRRFSHVLDPRTGQPAAASASSTIVAPTAAVADVVATAAGIHPPTAAIEFLDDIEASAGIAVAGLFVDHDGTCLPSRRWEDRFGRPSGHVEAAGRER